MRARNFGMAVAASGALLVRGALLFISAIAVAAATAGGAQATLVTLNDLQNQTTDGQNFNFLFTGLAASDGAGGTFVIHARGDYGAQSGETLTWTIEAGGHIATLTNATLGFCVVNTCNTGGPFTSATQLSQDQSYDFVRTYTISAAELNGLLSDSQISLLVDLGSSVNTYTTFGQYVEVTFTYNSAVAATPLPAALPMFLAGAGLIGGLAGYRKRRKDSRAG